ncbi:MAG TPA: selenoneine biosynthesis selenosugar synthase SenB, partial [Burkholderiales bacterium]
LLRASGHRVRVALAWQGEPCDALIALHARRSADSIARYAATGKPLVVTLTGTDLYKDLPASAEARRSLELADRVIVLQEAAPAALEPALRRKTRVVFQSAAPRARRAPPAGRFRVVVIGHLRAEKDPLRAVAALHLLADANLQLVQIGGALDPALGREAESWMQREPRYRWLGALPHGRALAWLARSHALVVSSVMEGGANVIAEAARIGTPVLASRVPGNVGMLGARYPGYYPLGDQAALARLMQRARADRRFYRQLRSALGARRALFAPVAERRSLARVLDEALAPRSSRTLARTAALDQSSSPYA